MKLAHRASIGVALVSTLAWLVLAIQPLRAVGSLVPKTLLIYYAYPSSINATVTVAGAAAEFGKYDYVVLGDGLEKPAHSDHQNTVDIIAHPMMARTTVFGYIDLGVTTQNLPDAEVRLRIDQWKATGADGVLFDDFGYDFDTGRDRQNTAVNYAHRQHMQVVVNAFRPEDAFSSTVDPAYNPIGTKTQLGPNDRYLFESYQIREGAFESETIWRSKADAVRAFQQRLHFKVFSITTSDGADVYDPAKFFYAWFSALLDGHNATGWGEYSFSADDAQAPFRARPAVNPGNAFTSDIIAASPLFTRKTSTGVISVNTATHTGGFIPRH